MSRGIVVSLFTGGAFCGAGLAGPIGDKLGRRWSEYSLTLLLFLPLIRSEAIIVGCVIYLIGGAFQTGAMNLHYLWAGRFTAGLGVGFLVTVVPIFQYAFPRLALVSQFSQYHYPENRT